MKWIKTQAFAARPLVIVEDHMFHLQEILRILEKGAPYWLAHATLVSLDRPGPDTTRTIRTWLKKFPDLQVATRLDSEGLGLLQDFPERLMNLPDKFFDHQISFCNTIASLIRPGGFLVQDIQLSTLAFLPSEEWWASIYLANSIRGRFPKRPPMCWFMSNKTGFSISFGRELMEAGFDPREVIDKSKLGNHFVPTVIEDLREAFPLELNFCQGGMEPRHMPIHPDDRKAVETTLDLLLWQTETYCELSGTQLSTPSGKTRVGLRPGSHEIRTWQQLIQDYFDLGPGIGVDELGGRIAAEGADKAERTNAAARHIHALRKRLRNAQAIVTQNHRYQICSHLKVGRIAQAKAHETQK